MTKNESIEKILKDYKFNKARITFLENQMNRLTPEAYSDYIESKMFAPGYSGAVVKFTQQDNVEIAQLNKVEETSQCYREDSEVSYTRTMNDMGKELSILKYLTIIVEDSLEIIGRFNKRHKTVIERYYVNNDSMETIAESLHLSRSRCYELCKEAVEYMVKIVYGTTCEINIKPVKAYASHL